MSLLATLQADEERGSLESPAVPFSGLTIMAAANQNTNTPFGIITSQVALTSSVVWACVRVRAETIASLPLNLYRRRADGGKERATDHPLWSLLHDKPNDVMSSYSWRERLIYAKLLQGNSYDYVKRNGGGMPIELIPLDSTKVGVGVKNDQKIYGYGGEFFGVNDFVHILNMTIDGVKGQSTIEYARTSIALDLAQSQYGTRYFSQGTSGNMWIEMPGVLTDEQKRRFRESWTASYTGVGNAFVPPMLGAGAKIHQLTLANDDAQFLGSRQFSVSEVARWFRVPGHKVGDLSKASYASLEQQNTEFVSDTIRPDCVQIEQEFNNRLLLPSERDKLFFEFDLNGLLRGDQKSRYDSYAVGRQWGWLSADDVRDLENMNKLPDDQGTIYMIPVNMASAKTLLVLPAPGALGAPAVVVEDESEGEDLQDESGDRAISAATDAAAITLDDAMQRMYRKEREAMKRAANKPGALAEVVKEFYTKHESLLAQAIYPSLRALYHGIVAHRRLDKVELAAAVHREDPAKTFAGEMARQLCERSRSALLRNPPAQFDEVMDGLGAGLPTMAEEQAAAFAAKFPKGTKS